MKKWLIYTLSLCLLLSMLPMRSSAAEAASGQVESITLDQSSLELCVGQSAVLAAAIQPELSTEPVITWTSSDASVVKLTGPGQLLALATGDAVITVSAGEKTASCQVRVRFSKKITVTAGAQAQLFEKNNYYSYTEVTPAWIQETPDTGTTTFHFFTKASDLSWRVSMAGKITKAGYLDNQTPEIEVLYSDTDASPDARPNYASSGQANSAVAEDGVLLNINGQNCLQLAVGDTKTLKAYRAWEIIQSHQNHVIMPDFTYTILSGSDVVSLEERESPSNGNGDWMTLTARKNGVAIIEVTYDAIEISGGSYDGVYGATDPARTGLLVVQVGGGAKVDFGIESYSSLSSPAENHIPYNASGRRAWDAEFDTLYFTGSSGELSFRPSGAGITSAAVSNDKGSSWTDLTAADGVYTARIVSGNNILRVTTSNGTAYQVVRGDKISVRYTEKSGDGDRILEPGETARVYLEGLHTPIPKVSGNYNPGYEANTDGYSPVHLNYTCSGTAIHGPGKQYDFITAANYVDVVLPKDGSTELTLTDGYIGVGVLGWKDFLTADKGHRHIPDEGCGMLYGESSFHTRSILPEITIAINGAAAPNSAPTVKGGALTGKTITLGQSFAINPETLFADPDGDALTYTVSVNSSEAAAVASAYKYTPAAAGTYQLKFTASDGELAVSHTITLTVGQKPQTEEKESFGLKESEIAGYVTIGFEDRGIRVAGETGLKYPVALGTILSQTRVPFKAGDNIAQVTLRLLDAKGIGYRYSGSVSSNFYLSAIKNFVVNGTPYDEMGEFDAGQGSGWMITLNDWFIDKSTSAFTVKNGDVIQWKYTCQVGKDIGDDYSSAGSQIVGGGTGTVVENGRVQNGAAEAAVMEAADIYAAVGDYLEALGTPTVNSIGGEWMVIGLARSGRTVPEGYYDNVVAFVQENINEWEQLHRAKSTENSRLILALTALGRDVTNVDGHDLLTGLTDMAYLQKQGINGPIWALIAFDSGNYAIPEGDVTREGLITAILEAQLPDGGWTLSGNVSDSDMTGMAVQALAPYYEENPQVKAAVDKALLAMSRMQNADGSFSSVDGPSSESIAQIIVALTALGIDPDTDERFVKNGASAIDALLVYYVPGSGFRHVPGGAADGMATEQGYYALVSYQRMLENKTALYDMTDVIDRGGDCQEAAEETTEPTAETEAPPAKPEQGGSWLPVVLLAALVCTLGIAAGIYRKKRFG